MNEFTIIGGHDKHHTPEPVTSVSLKAGCLYSIVGNTGSGKSQLIKDIEQLTDRNSISGRQILVNNNPIPMEKRLDYSTGLIAHLAQNMRFVLDIDVETFIKTHINCRNNISCTCEEVIEAANQITPEPISAHQKLTVLSGGQSRALMIADIAHVCNSPVVLIDEIENAGIDKIKALNLLINMNKLVLIVTHDVHTALMADTRIIMKNGAMYCVKSRTTAEKDLYQKLEQTYSYTQHLQKLLRKGDELIE